MKNINKPAIYFNNNLNFKQKNPFSNYFFVNSDMSDKSASDKESLRAQYHNQAEVNILQTMQQLGFANCNG